MKTRVEVKNLKPLQREVRRMKDKELNAEMKKANKAAAQVAVDDGKPRAPKVSGSLAGTIKAANSAKYAAVKAGSPKKVPYAGVIHFGWPARNIKPQPFLDDAIRENFGEIRDTYEDALRAVVALLESKKL